MLGILVVALVALLFYCIYIQSTPISKKYRLPKGPPGLPFFGNLLQMVHNPHEKLTQWSSKYGKIFTINLAGRRAVVLSDCKLMKDVLSRTVATGKFKSDSMLVTSQGNFGILSTEGKQWSEQRNFCIKTLKEFGFGRGTLEPIILEDMNRVNNWIEKEIRKSSELILHDVLKPAMNGALWKIISGEKLDLNDTEVQKLSDNFLVTMNCTVESGLAFFPWLKHIAPGMSGYTGFDRACKDLHKFMQRHIDNHRNRYIGGCAQDLIDAYIEKIDNCKDPKSEFYGKRGETNFVSTLVELFSGAGDTTSATLIWTIYYLSWNTDIQNTMRKEIDDVVGKFRDVCLHDRDNMPYTQAVILETLRCISLLPLGIMHELLDDLETCGYTLPKGTILIPNMYGCHNSKEVWGDPQIFRPERFLQDRQLRECLVPFQPGKRSCPGEPLAKEVIFLFTVMLFREWEVAPTPGIKKSKYFEVQNGVLLLPKRVPIVFKHRKRLVIH